MTYTPPKFDPHKAKQRGCVDKVAYGKREARRRARMIRDSGDPVHAYACPHCRRYHVGADWER